MPPVTTTAVPDAARAPETSPDLRPSSREGAAPPRASVSPWIGGAGVPLARDLAAGLGAWRLWSALAWEDLRQRFSRSYIGILWTTISFAVFVAVKVLIFSPLNDAGSASFALYVAIGFFAWVFINASVVDACAVFLSAETWIKSAPLPLTTWVLQAVLRNVILAGYSLIVVVLTGALVGHGAPLAGVVVSAAVFGLMIVNAWWLGTVLGAVCSRYRDVMHLVQTIMRVMFFLTPVLWLPDQLGGLWTYLRFNPLAHFVIALRDPVLYGTIPWLSLGVVLGVTVIGLAAAAWAHALVRSKIVFWL